MKSVEFCYWLQGLFELGKPEALNAEQTDLVRRHLAMVFTHEIDPSYGPNDQKKLNELHGAGVKADPMKIGGKGPTDILYRC